MENKSALGWQPKKWLHKKSRQTGRGYPVASVAFYGSTDGRASKVAVGIVNGSGGRSFRIAALVLRRGRCPQRRGHPCQNRIFTSGVRSSLCRDDRPGNRLSARRRCRLPRRYLSAMPVLGWRGSMHRGEALRLCPAGRRLIRNGPPQL